MKFTVVWHRRAEALLADIWIHAPDRQAVTVAAYRIEQALSSSPEDKGEDYFGDRLIIEEPLSAPFAVYPDDRRVEILQVWHH